MSTVARGCPRRSGRSRPDCGPRAAQAVIGTKFAEGVATEVAESLRSGMARLYRAVKARLQGDAEGRVVLERLEGSPTARLVSWSWPRFDDRPLGVRVRVGTCEAVPRMISSRIRPS